MSTDTSDAVFRFFDRVSPHGVPGETIEAKLACAYLDAQVIDSMGIVEMIAELEERFGIRFGADDLQADEFQTVGGLIATVERLRGGK